MVAPFAFALDYEFVIFLCAGGGFGFPEFISWQEQTPCLPATTLNFEPTGNTMKTATRTTLSTITMAIASAAFSLGVMTSASAQEATIEPPLPSTSQATRAQVQAELQRARADSSYAINESQVGHNSTTTGQRSRADVRAETLAAMASGELRALSSEGGAPYVANVRVRQEAAPRTLVIAGK
jgi:hypothetical protein